MKQSYLSFHRKTMQVALQTLVFFLSQSGLIFYLVIMDKTLKLKNKVTTLLYKYEQANFMNDVEFTQLFEDHMCVTLLSSDVESQGTRPHSQRPRLLITTAAQRPCAQRQEASQIFTHFYQTELYFLCLLAVDMYVTILRLENIIHVLRCDEGKLMKIMLSQLP